MSNNNNSGNNSTPTNPPIYTFTYPVNTAAAPNTTTIPLNGTTVWFTTVGDLGGFTLTTEEPKKKEKSSGCSCKKCREFNEYAEPNQDDGTFVCYTCRKGY